MAKYRVQQKATIWYETNIEADTPEEAVRKIQEDSTLDLDWWQVIDTTEFQATFWLQDEDENETNIDGDEI
jgi:hypothetical protein